ncbi:TRM3 [Acanthosepion pharaonis]|uniref:TRM3 n=1 Tax=Acanthosepion pharaonis TaxID=158019 RepID=A0A812B6T0_ACAPH|nr:TRM3 [Sepia pharaonis]
MLSHVGPWLEEEAKQQKFYDSAFTHLLPLCMNHHFSTRIHAQATICKMWRQCKSLGLDNILSKFALVEGCIQFNDGSNATKNTLKLMESYFMATFDPVRDYSIETIFLTLPKLTCLTDEEWLPPEMFSDMDPTWLDANALKLLSLYNGRDSLNSSKSGPWRVKIHSLCRTSEIFGIKEYVIGSMRHLVDKNFSSLSVTAEKWIPIREVPSEYLQNFLIEKQRDGYALVGAEQTANSRCLTDYEFPMKTVLILGNEREGIPASLISLLDVCVEIPQQGVIRSLNVHVSGALLMWEYTRQMHSHRTKTSSNQKSL